jgi:molecular chaperone GrpE
MKHKTKHEEAVVERADAPSVEDRVGEGEGATAPEVEAKEPETVETLRARIETLEEKLLRVAADFENRRKRVEQQRDDAIRFANVDLLRTLLVIVDDFDRSLAAAGQADSIESVVKGEALIHANLVKALRDFGLEEIDALHKPFAPACHEALLQQPSSDHPAGTVLEEVARGYRFRDRVVRPSKVIVSKAVEAAADTPSGDADAADPRG